MENKFRHILLFLFLVSSHIFSLAYPVTNTEFYKDGVVIRSVILECGDNEILTFEISNNNDYEVTIGWYEEVWVDNICKQDGKSIEHYREIHLNQNQIIIGDCSFKDSFYILYSLFRKGSKMSLTHFDLKDIQVKIKK